MASWVDRLRGTSRGIPNDDPTAEQAQPRKRFPTKTEPPDPNAPIRRLLLHQRCLYERLLPGDAFISAHVNRMQKGYWESTKLHESPLENVYFVSIHFVFHPQNHRSHRFKQANIRVSVHGFDPAEDFRRSLYGPPPASPRILKHAPELIYGAVSPENLQWNFNLSSSLGVSQAPVSASLNPSGGVRSSYKVFDMMSIQGSLRTLQSPFGPEYDVEDAMAIWTLEENLLQRSGLPRENDFVMLVHKPNGVKKMHLTVDVDAVVESRWFGSYPQWYTNLNKYLPIQDYTLDFNSEIGQRFTPSHPKRGFNFAGLPKPLEEYVGMPGTMYPSNDNSTMDEQDPPPCPWHDDADCQHDQNYRSHYRAVEPASASQQPGTPARRQMSSGQFHTTNRHSWVPETLNVRVMLEHGSPQSPSPRRYSGSPINNLDPTRRHSIRRRRSRAGLKEFSAQQALQDTARAN